MCWLVQRISSVLLGRWSVVVIRLVEGAFIRTGCATDTTTAEITGTKAPRRAVGWILSILADWHISRRILLTGSFARLFLPYFFSFYSFSVITSICVSKSINDKERGGNCLLVPQRSYGPDRFIRVLVGTNISETVRDRPMVTSEDIHYKVLK